MIAETLLEDHFNKSTVLLDSVSPCKQHLTKNTIRRIQVGAY